MPPPRFATATPRCRALYAPHRDDQPLGFQLFEALLEARSGSMFPTNGAGPDEDVNVYLAHLLGRFLFGNHDSRVVFGAGALFHPPERSVSRRSRADWYRANGDHRLLHLGLFGRGDGLRRRAELFACLEGETRARDLVGGRVCYEVASNLLRGRGLVDAAAVAVLDKLATHFDDYVHVLTALATRHFGLGAHLDDIALAHLAPVPTPTEAAAADAATVECLLTAPPPPDAMDDLLDLWSSHRSHPTPATASRLRNMADQLGVRLLMD